MKGNKSEFFTSVIKAFATAIVVSLAAVLVFALIVKITGLGEAAIKTVNQFIKVISLFIGCFISLKNGAGLIKGALVGAAYCVVLYLIFLISGSNSFSAAFWLDLLFCTAIGAISGVITVNVRAKA